MGHIGIKIRFTKKNIKITWITTLSELFRNSINFGTIIFNFVLINSTSNASINTASSLQASKFCGRLSAENQVRVLSNNMIAFSFLTAFSRAARVLFMAALVVSESVLLRYGDIEMKRYSALSSSAAPETILLA